MSEKRTKHPLTVYVDAALLTHPEVVRLIHHGHTVLPLLEPHDLILSTRAWRWDEKYVGLAVKSAQHEKLKREEGIE